MYFRVRDTLFTYVHYFSVTVLVLQHYSILSLIQPRPGKAINYRDPPSFDLFSH
jgi:hypothetical protein